MWKEFGGSGGVMGVIDLCLSVIIAVLSVSRARVPAVEFGGTCRRMSRKLW